MVNIAICICTRKRPKGIIALLESINRLVIPNHVSAKIVIVENDVKPLSDNIIKDFSQKCVLPVYYFLENQQGIAFARNRAVKEAGQTDFCCFVDDDQIVDENWLSELVRCQEEYDAQGVSGPNPPLFKKAVPIYINDFHQPDLHSYGERIRCAYTNCLLLQKTWLDKFEGPFNLRLNFTGGEDSYLTAQITNLGGEIRYNPDAIAYEIVPESRSTIKYVIKRTLRMTNTRFLYESLLDENFKIYSEIPRLILRFGLGTLLVIPYFLFGRKEKLKGIIKICDALGGLLFIFGRKNRFYK